jgi:DNA polymerase-3 subunit epsilon
MDYFIAVDVETANRERSSICQIGLVCFNGDGIEWQWSTLVNPECDFEPHNIRIHRITPDAVAAAPKWPAVFACIADSLRGQMVASHTNFDEYALMEACRRYGLPPPQARWLDSHALARRMWPDFTRHGLAELCAAFDIDLDHHDALSDAMACGRIVKLCLAGTPARAAGMEMQALAVANAKPSRASRFKLVGHQEDVAAQDAPDGPLREEVVVLSGEFDGGKGPLAALAASAGCRVDAGFTKSRTTILVVGRRDPEAWGGIKSGKHLRAEAAIAEGCDIRILTEVEFRRLVDYAASSPPVRAAV